LKTIKDLFIPFIILTLAGAFGIYFRPLMIIDETRYIGVAWEMWDSGNFLVPHLNGVPYDHKFPLLFWLIHLTWAIFGVNSVTPRVIPLLFAIGDIVLTYKIYKELFKSDELGIKLIGYITSAIVLFQFYSSLLMFDVMLSFFALLGIYAMILIAKGRKGGFLLFVLSIFLGVLAKGPVVGAHFFALFLFAFWWVKDNLKQFYLKTIVGGILGLALSALWIVPAIISGGKVYGKGLLLKQSVGRIEHSFAHARPIWWYLPLIPAFSFPWIIYAPLFKSIKSNFKMLISEWGFRFVLIWLIGTFIIFSLISGKQVHYIMPELFALSILITRLLTKYKAKIYRFRVYGVLILFLAILFASIPFIVKGYFAKFINFYTIYLNTVIFAIVGIYFIVKRFTTLKSLITATAISTPIFMFALHSIFIDYLKVQDLTKFSKEIAKLQNSSYTIINDRKYADQFHFLGRLHKPIKVIWGYKNIKAFMQKHPNSAVVTYLDRRKKFDNSAILAKTKFRTKNAVLIDASKFEEFIKSIK